MEIVNQCEAVKLLNLKTFLENRYGLNFQRFGTTYKCLSPFTNETEASFCVSTSSDGHWLFYDYSSGYSGSIVDFVLTIEHLDKIHEALNFINTSSAQCGIYDGKNLPSPNKYDITKIYTTLRNTSLSDSLITYLKNRGIPYTLIKELEQQGVLLDNTNNNNHYCSFAVFDNEGKLCCIDNHNIEKRDKFVLGKKYGFNLGWDKLFSSEKIFICEGIIDYLSIRILLGNKIPGIALMGISLLLPPDLFGNVSHIISGFDNDKAGRNGFSKIRTHFPNCQFSSFDLKNSKDPNDYLLTYKGDKLLFKSSKLDSKIKCSIATSTEKSLRKSAEEHGVHHSTISDIRKEGKEVLIQHWEDKSSHLGRPPKSPEIVKKVEIEKQVKTLKKDNALKEMRISWLELQLKWEKERFAEATGNKNKSKKQLKKKRKKRKWSL